MLLYYVQDVYQKNKLGKIKDRHDPRKKHQRKTSVASVSGAGGIWRGRENVINVQALKNI